MTRVALVDELASLLRERIYTGRYPAGSRLPQQQLSLELGVSRTPLREALRVLEQDGLVRLESGQGARVVSADVRTLLAAYELRAVVDGLAARLAAERPSAVRGARLDRLIERQHRALDPWQPRQYTQANVDFHEQIVHLTGNEFVIAQTPILRMTAQVFAPVALIEPSGALRAVAEHRAIHDALTSGSPTDAERLARAHIETTIVQLRARRSAPEKTGSP